MYKIKIEDNQFKCPMLKLVISERGDLNYGTCRICKNNVLSRFIDDYVYCNFGSTSGGSSGGNSGGNENPGGNNDPEEIIEDPDTPWEEYQP